MTAVVRTVVCTAACSVVYTVAYAVPRAQSQLEHLSDAAATWREFEAERAALAAAMEADRRRLGLLQQAITGDRDGSHVTGPDVTAADVTGTDVTGADGARSDVNGVTDGPGGTAGVADRVVSRAVKLIC